MTGICSFIAKYFNILLFCCVSGMISGGGTMTREAAVLGVPSYSFFRGREGQVDAWLESPSLRLLPEGPGYEKHLSRMLSTSKATGARVHDARIAALCEYHGVRELWSADRDFSRFPAPATRNPLVT